jgi:hypothetical protein
MGSKSTRLLILLLLGRFEQCKIDGWKAAEPEPNDDEMMEVKFLLDGVNVKCEQ